MYRPNEYVTVISGGYLIQCGRPNGLTERKASVELAFGSANKMGQGDDVGGCQCRHKQAVHEYNAVRRRADDLSIFGVST